MGSHNPLSLPCVKGGGTACRDGGIVLPAESIFCGKSFPNKKSLSKTERDFSHIYANFFSLLCSLMYLFHLMKP